MKNVLFITLTIIMLSCKTEAKKEDIKEPNIESERKEEKTKELTKRDYPIIDYKKELTYLYEDGYMFSDDIELIDISIALNDDKSYDFVLSFEKDSNLDRLSNYAVGLITYPSQTDEIVKKGFPSKIQILEDHPVIILKNFETKIKHQRLVKFYLYDKAGILNKKMLQIQNIVFP